MSRCILDNDDDGNQVVVGWDPGLTTYFAQVIEPGDETPSIWLGTRPLEFLEPSEIISIVKPYACSFDNAVLAKNLKQDKLSNSERNYAIDGKRVW